MVEIFFPNCLQWCLLEVLETVTVRFYQVKQKEQRHIVPVHSDSSQLLLLVAVDCWFSLQNGGKHTHSCVVKTSRQLSGAVKLHWVE